MPQHVVAEAARRLQARARGGLARQRANSVRARLFALVTLAAVRLQARVRGRLARRRADAMRRVRDFARIRSTFQDQINFWPENMDSITLPGKG